MDTSTVSHMGYIKTFKVETDDKGNKQLLLSYGHDASMTYSILLSIPDDPDLLKYVENRTGTKDLGEVSAVAVTQIDDSASNIGQVTSSRWNREKAAKATMSTPLGTFCFTLRPGDKSELAELLKPTRKEKGFKAWLRKLLR